MERTKDTQDPSIGNELGSGGKSQPQQEWEMRLEPLTQDTLQLERGVPYSFDVGWINMPMP